MYSNEQDDYLVAKMCFDAAWSIVEEMTTAEMSDEDFSALLSEQQIDKLSGALRAAEVALLHWGVSVVAMRTPRKAPLFRNLVSSTPQNGAVWRELVRLTMLLET
jgi:predicted metal-binding membrane protein